MRYVSRGSYLLSICLMVFAVATSALFGPLVYSAQITPRTLTLQAGAGGDGGSKPGGSVRHQFNFTLPTSTSVGSIKFEYCTLAAGGGASCTTPTGLVTTSATLTNETGATGFSMVNTTNGAPYLTRTASAASGAVSYQLSSITNPTAANETFYVWISTYASTNATGTAIDEGTVAASTAEQIVLTGVMPESIIFCTGATVPAISNVPDCPNATPGTISFNQQFSPSDTATATSQMAASTNAPTGYVITVNGTTMTSGANTIPAMVGGGGSSIAGVRGTGQFGMNLRANTTTTSTPAVGADVSLAPDGVDLKGEPATGYNTADQFRFVSGETVATSTNGGAGPTNGQIFTASYIVNVAGNQLAGTYTTTLTYICTATF